METEQSLLHFYRFITLNTKARVLNYKCRALQSEISEWQKSFELLWTYDFDKWKQWEERKMPNTSIHRQINTILEFYLAYQKYCHIHNLKIDGRLKSKVSKLAYSWKDLISSQDKFDFTYGSLWHASQGKDITELLKLRKDT